MQTRSFTLATTLALTALIAACNGPTKGGIEAREQARNRIDEYSASFTYDQAMQEFKSGQFDRALSDINAAIEALPESARFHVLQGRIHLETDKLEDAIQSFLTAMEHDPEFAEAHYYAGIVFQRWSDDEQAYNYYGEAYEIEPDQVHYLLAKAEALIALGELDEARDLINDRLTYFEYNSAMRHLLGQIALLEGDAEAAAQLYNEAWILEPENTLLLEELAWVQYEASMFAECSESVDQLLQKYGPKRVDLKHLKARCFTMLGRASEAHGLYVTLSHESPSNVSVWIEFGTLAWKLSDYRRLAQCSLRTIDLAPERYEGYMLKGLNERHLGRLPQAVKLFRQAAELTDDTALPYMLLGRSLEESGKGRDALVAYGKAVEIDPNSKEARMLHATLKRSQIATAGE